jgi:hypothetical protein
MDRFNQRTLNISGNTSSNLDSNNKNTNSNFRFTFTPEVGFFISDNFAIGANINLGVYNTTTNSKNLTSLIYTQTSDNQFTYGLGIFARRYFKIADKFIFFLNGNISYAIITEKDNLTSNNPGFIPPTETTPNTDKISVNINPGMVYFVTPKLGIETSFGSLYYNLSTSKNKKVSYDNHISNSIYGLNLNVSTFAIGLHYYF